jgi:LPXTG-motif cell wall-anchored protein
MPDFNPAACGPAGEAIVDGSYVVKPGLHVTYRLEINDVDQGPIAVGPHSVTTYPTKITIVAVADDGFALDPADQSWSYTFVAPVLCELPELDLITPETSFTPLTCEANGSYSFGGDGVVWTVNGGAGVPDTYTVSSNTTVILDAEPAEGHGWEDANQQTHWEYTFAKSGCDLDTLAITGATTATGLVGGAILLLLAGGAFIAVRRREA